VLLTSLFIVIGFKFLSLGLMLIDFDDLEGIFILYVFPKIIRNFYMIK